MSIASASSLLKYDTPFVITTNSGKKQAKRGGETTHTQDMLNSILPPRQWTEDGKLFMQRVSSTPATKLDIINLQEQLNSKLQQQKARETGICPVREELYSQCFDELIRQITINCAERGLLLLRVRDEIRMTLDAYQTLYESGIAFGIRKALVADQTRSDLKEKIRMLKEENEQLEQSVKDMEEKCEMTRQEEEIRQKHDREAKQAEVEEMKKANLQLRQNLEQLLTAPKK